jgi:hypothetical protein
MHKLVLIRHGESTWNLENRFTGWTDVPLTPTGIEQAKTSGRLLREGGWEFDLCYTSVLKRATHTLWHCLDEMDRQWLPVVKSWRLNERPSGALQGLNKASEMVRVCRAAMNDAASPIFERARAAGAIRPDTNLDDVLRLVSGVTAGHYESDEQRERVLALALDAIRTPPAGR